MNKMTYEGKFPHQLFEEQVLISGSNRAVFSENCFLNYRDLNDKANQLAHYLREELHIAPGDSVGVCTTHDPERVLSLMAIAKAGAIYVPIDPFYPADLINYMTGKIDAKIILVNRSELFAKEQELTARLVNLDAIKLAQYSNANLPLTIKLRDPMYIIFTSGSTGRPKAVAVSHEAAHNHFAWIMDYTSFEPNDIWLQTINPSFDPSMHELMAPLMIGGSIGLIGGLRKLDSREITDAIIRHQATHITTVPTMLTLLVNTPNFSACRSLKHVCVGGEVFRPALAEKALAQLPNTVFHNVYGPTEATIMASGWKIEAPQDREALPIGPAIYNMAFYLKTDDGKIISTLPNSEGELCISGVSLANGYVNDEGLTNERFVQNTLEMDPQSMYHRLYFSGDRCRVDAEGNIYCLGRLDDQVKINGQRVELAEIEYQFSTLPEVHDVGALLIEGDLIIALVPTTVPNHEESWLAQVREKMEKKLPKHMLPKRMKILDAIPRQAVSAKADRKKLMEILAAMKTPEHFQKLTAKQEELSLEETVAKMVAEIIQDDIDSDSEISFADLGLDSVDLQMLTLRLSKHFNVEIRTEDLFEYYTIGKLASFIDEHMSCVA